MMALLAGEREAGRLRVSPVLVLPESEGLPISEYEPIARIFNAKVCRLYRVSCG